MASTEQQCYEWQGRDERSGIFDNPYRGCTLWRCLLPGGTRSQTHLHPLDFASGDEATVPLPQQVATPARRSTQAAARVATDRLLAQTLASEGSEDEEH